MSLTCFGTNRLNVISLSDSLLGEMSVPFDLVKKQPKGQQTFALMTKDTVTGSLTTEVRSSSQLTLYYDSCLCLISIFEVCALSLNIIWGILCFSLPTWTPVRWGPGTLPPQPPTREWRWTVQSCPVVRWSPLSPRWRASQDDYSLLHSTWV